MANFELKKLTPSRIALKHFTRNWLIDLAGAAQIYIGVVGAVIVAGHIVLPIIGTGLLTIITGRIMQIRDVLYEKDELDWERM